MAARFSGNTYYSMAVSDPNANGYFQWVLNGTLQASATAPWLYGYVTTNGERHNTSDSAWAEFDGLRYMNKTAWQLWTSAALFCDTDPSYDNSIVTNTHVKVILTGSGYVQC